jgi:hypothetical protein
VLPRAPVAIGVKLQKDRQPAMYGQCLLKFKIQYFLKPTDQRRKSGCGYERIYLYFWKRNELINVVIVNTILVPGIFLELSKP